MFFVIADRTMVILACLSANDQSQDEFIVARRHGDFILIFQAWLNATEKYLRMKNEYIFISNSIRKKKKIESESFMGRCKETP